MAFRIQDPYAVPGEFRKAQLHCHTTASDGRFRARDLLRMYRDAGYTFVFITDHNRVTYDDGLNGEAFLALPGTEDTVSPLPPLGPHMGRLFVTEPLRSGSAQERIDRTVAAGGLVSLCHPSWPGNLWSGRWTDDQVRRLRGFHLIEIHSPHSDPAADLRRWAAALAAHGPTAPVWGVAVDDCHHAGQFNRGWIMVKTAEVSASALYAALRAGAFYASTGAGAGFAVQGGTIAVRADEPLRLRFIDQRGAVRLERTAAEAAYAVSGDEGYVRVEGRGAAGRLWSQPFWIISDEQM